MRDNPFKHLTDDELFEAYKLADQRYFAVLTDESDESWPSNRAALVAWIIRSGEMSVVCWEYLDEMRRRRKPNAETIEAMESTDLIGPFNNVEDLFTALDADDDGG